MALSLNRDLFRKNLLEFTQRAFQMLPPLKAPSILDIGCGSGVQTIELARISRGHVTAFDIDLAEITKLRTKVHQAGISDRIDVIEMSMLEMDLPEATFDIIWAEGSIFVVGFRRGLLEWSQHLRKGGFLVIHDTNQGDEDKKKIIKECGYTLLNQFIVTHEEWWEKYYHPLEKYLQESDVECSDTTALLGEIQTFKKNRTASIFYILQKN